MKEAPGATFYSEEIRSIAYSQNLSHGERFNILQELNKKLSFESIDIIKMSVHVDQDNNKWSYKIAAGSLELLNREPMDIEGDTLLDRF